MVPIFIMSKNYHKILGVTKESSDDEIKTAYRNLAKKLHPDVNKQKDAEDKFKELNEAYEHVINKKEDESDFIQNSSTFHRQIYRQVQPDIHMQIDIDFMKACHGSEEKIGYQYHNQCKKCAEHKKNHGKINIKYCGTCKGSGILRIQNGPFNIGVPCPQCNGQGSFLDCDECRGQGSYVDNKEVTIKIPSGADSGKILRVQGFGNYDFMNELFGDLYLHIQVINKTQFTRQDDNIFGEINLNYLDCLLGGEFSVKTIHGDIKIVVPECTENGKVLRITNEGVNHIGHHYVTTRIQIPKILDKRTKRVLTNLKKLNKN